MRGDQVKKILTESGYVLKDIAETMGESPQNLQSMLKSNDIKTGVLENIAKAINKNLYFFFDNIGEDLNQYRDHDHSDNFNSIPYFPEINASAGLDFLTDNSHNYNVPIKIPNVDAQAFINVFGDSMYPKYCSGEIIGIKEIGKDFVMYGYAYVVQMADGEAYLKYIRKGVDEEHWVLASENPKYEPKEFHISKIKKVFIIKAVISKTTII